MGKSSVLGVAAEQARAGKPRAVVVVADVSTATSLFDVATRLLRSLYKETRSLRIRIEEIFGGLAPKLMFSLDDRSGAPSISFGVERRTASDEERRRALEAVVERLDLIRARTKHAVAVILDEFQAINALGGEPAEWHLRDLIQRHGGLSFVCAGSQEALIHDMIGRRRAFYKMFELLHLGPLEEDHFASWLDGRLATGLDVRDGVGREIVRLAGPRTQDVVQVARHLYFRAITSGATAGLEDVAGAIDEVVRNEEPLIRTIWSALSAQQQDVLRVVALGVEQLLSTEVRDRYGLPGASSVAKAVDTLVQRGLLVRDGDEIRFDSPFFLRWVQREVAADIG